ncbi:MAG: hypothetical protein ACOYXN_05095 [Acidobacteriota bacterium]
MTAGGPIGPGNGMAFWGVGAALGFLLSCQPSPSDSTWRTLQGEAEKAHRPYVVLLLAPEQGCSCAYLEAFIAARRALAEAGHPGYLRLVTRSARATAALEAEGVSREEMVEDPDGSLAEVAGVRSEDLPYFVVVRTEDPKRHVLGLRLAGPPALQRQVAGLLDILLYDSGG